MNIKRCLQHNDLLNFLNDSKLESALINQSKKKKTFLFLFIVLEITFLIPNFLV